MKEAPVHTALEHARSWLGLFTQRKTKLKKCQERIQGWGLVCWDDALFDFVFASKQLACIIVHQHNSLVTYVCHNGIILWGHSGSQSLFQLQGTPSWHLAIAISHLPAHVFRSRSICLPRHSGVATKLLILQSTHWS